MKKVLSILIVFAMLLSLPITVFAADGGATPKPTDIGLKNGAINNGNQFLQYDPLVVDDDGNTMFACDGTYMTPRAGLVSPYTGKAPSNAVLQYRHAMKGDYELSYQMKLNKDNKETLFNYFYWQDFIESGRSFLTSSRGAGLALQVGVGDGKVTLTLRRYDAAGGNKPVSDAVVTGEVAAPILEGAEPHALLNVSLK